MRSKVIGLEDKLETGLNKALTVLRPENHWQVMIVAAELADALNLQISLGLSALTGPKFEVKAR